MTTATRRTILGGGAAVAAFAPRFAIGQPATQEIVVAAAQPLTGVFSLPGNSLHAGLGDFCAWKNANGGVQGRKLRYVAEDTGFKLDQGVAVFKKLMASEKPSFFYGDRTEWVRAVAPDAIAAGNVVTASPSFAGVLSDVSALPHHFIAGPTYGAMHEILMESIARISGANKPKIALVYTEMEFGTDGIPASKARAEKLGLPVVAEVVTKTTGIDVAAEVAKLRRAKPDVVVFQGYVLNPIPEFVRQMREAGLTVQPAGTVWSLDRPTYEAVAAAGEGFSGVSPYRYASEDTPMMKTIRDYVAQTRPDFKGLSFFYIHAWLTGMIFAEIAERTIKADKPFTAANMKTAMESMTAWDSGGVVGLPIDLSSHQIKIGRYNKYNLEKKQMEPVSDWIRV